MGSEMCIRDSALCQSVLQTNAGALLRGDVDPQLSHGSVILPSNETNEDGATIVSSLTVAAHSDSPSTLVGSRCVFVTPRPAF